MCTLRRRESSPTRSIMLPGQGPLSKSRLEGALASIDARRGSERWISSRSWPAAIGRLAMDSLIAKLGLALAVGLLVGIERGWRERDAPDGTRTAGIRTYAITGLL